MDISKSVMCLIFTTKSKVLYGLFILEIKWTALAGLLSG